MFIDSAKKLPQSFLQRHVIDLGCGDGRISVKLRRILKPKTFRGVDQSRALVRTAKQNNINAEMCDIEKEPISGDLGILWAVAHHFADPIKTLQKINQNFNSLIIIEHLNPIIFFELGRRFGNKKNFKMILSKANIDIEEEIDVGKKVVIILTK